MKLLGTNTSPYVRKVRLVLLEKNIPHEYVVDPPREPGSLVARVNPLGRIPALILDDETCVFDSTVIAEYADTLNDHPTLIPRSNALERMRVKRWEALADGIMDSAVVVRKWCEGEFITLADLALVSALIYLDLRQGERDWRSAHPNLAAWFVRISERPSVRASHAG